MTPLSTFDSQPAIAVEIPTPHPARTVHNPAQRLRFRVDSDDDGHWAGESALLTFTAVDDE